MRPLDFLFPPRCVSCGRLGGYFCPRCTQKIEFIKFQICPRCTNPAIGGATHPRCQTPLGLDGMYALAHYKGPIKDAVHLLKYKLVSDLTKSLVFLLFKNFPFDVLKFDYLVPVPLHPQKQKERGFNQSEIIAEEIGKTLNVPVKTHLLNRYRYTSPQVKLERKNRLSNLKGAFSCNKNINIKYKTIAIIDDVSTTFTTLSECAKVLKRQGARSVWGIVLAHG